MPDNSNPNQPSHPPNAAPAKPRQPAPNFGHIPITEELDSAKWTLPPIIPVVIGLVLVAVVVVFVLFATKDKPYAALAITKIVSAPQDDNTMAAVQVKLDNQIDGPLYIKGIHSIGKKENPRRLEMLLNSILPPAKRIDYFKD